MQLRVLWSAVHWMAASGDQMIVITRNGQTRVVSGWRAGLYGALALGVAWAVLALIAFALVGAAFTIGVLLVLAVPAAVAVGLVGAAARRVRRLPPTT